MCFFCWFRIRFFISFSNCDQSIARWNSCISAYRHLPLNDAETRENWEKTFLRVHFVPPKFPHIYHLACQTASSTNSSRFPLVINCHKVCIVICGLDSYYQTLSSRVENSKKNILWQHAGASRKNFFPRWVGRGRGRWFWKKIKIQGLMYSRFSLLTTTYLLLLTKYRDLKLKSTLHTYYSQKNKFLLEVKIFKPVYFSDRHSWALGSPEQEPRSLGLSDIPGINSFCWRASSSRPCFQNGCGTHHKDPRPSRGALSRLEHQERYPQCISGAVCWRPCHLRGGKIFIMLILTNKSRWNRIWLNLLFRVSPIWMGCKLLHETAHH